MKIRAARLLKIVAFGWVAWAFRFGRARLRKFGRRVGLGFLPILSQYEKAQNLALQLKNYKGCSFSITGHSLGGGLASAAGLVTGLPTYTFNAAGVHKNTILDDHKDKLSQPNEHIKAYYADDDVLNQIQDKRYFDSPESAISTAAAGSIDPKLLINLPPALGNRINLGNSGCEGIACGHDMASVINIIEVPLKREITSLENEKTKINMLKEQLQTSLTACAASD